MVWTLAAAATLCAQAAAAAQGTLEPKQVQAAYVQTGTPERAGPLEMDVRAQLERFGIRIPATGREQNRAFIIGALLVFVLESALVAGLLLQGARRRRVEAALRASEARYRGVVETQSELICRCLPDTTLTFVNDAYCRFWRKRREDLIGTKFLDLIPASRRDDVRDRIRAVIESRGEMSHEHEVLLPDGTIGWQHWTNHPLVGDGGRIVELQASGRDITERKRAEEALRASDEALRASCEQVEDLAGRLIAAQEAERKRIARDLHDDLSQKLALLSIDIDQIPRRRPDEIGERVRDISGRAAEIASDIHRLAYELHPSKLESLGLVPALQSVCRDISRQHGLQVEFEHTRLPAEVPPDVSLCLYRIVQEALHNVVRHSGASKALVELHGSGDLLELHIADPGAGFVATARGNGGIGLVSMRERVNFVGGQIAIHSAPGEGTRIGVRVSVSRVPVAPLSSSRLMLGA